MIFPVYIFSVSALIVHCKKPSNKRLLATWRLECELGIITDSECPIDGGWSHWAPWSRCLGNCDNVGHRKRKRVCNNPLPSKDGLPCHGIEEEIESCHLKNCSIDDYRKIVKGVLPRTEALHQLEAVPILMERCLEMECPYEAVEAALATENIWQLNSEILWNALQCVKHDIGCLVKGEWSTWGSWSACGARCGKGLKWRLRRCDAPPPSAFNLFCLGVPIQTKECEGDQCAIEGQYAELSGTWSEWDTWTECSEKCGTGFRRRKRSCIEKHIPSFAFIWRTHCRGHFEEFEVCYNKKCVLDGGWSGWGVWGECSQTCGAGKRSRTRSCTRPLPSAGGSNCSGSKIDINSCHLKPCEVYSHMVSVFNGDSELQYNFYQIRSKLFHTYIRFLSLSPHGTLLRRGAFPNTIKISIHKWHVCLDANGSSNSCSLPRTCLPTPLEPSIWHSILVTVTNKAVTIRIDDAPTPLYSPFPCNPEFTNDKLNLYIGERLHGEIQELVFNFKPFSTFIDRKLKTKDADFFPTSSANIAYEKASTEEAMINLDNEYYLQLPCFAEQDELVIELTIKSKSESGTALFLLNHINSDWFYVTLDNMRVKIKYVSKDFKSEDSSSTECLPDQWLDIKIVKRKESNTMEMSINNAEHLHVLLSENGCRKRRFTQKVSIDRNCSIKNNYFSHFINTSIQMPPCTECFIGGIPLTLKHKISEDLSPFFGVIASLKIDKELVDLHKVNMERSSDKTIQLSSRSASISGSYQEVTWGETNMINLRCMYARATRSAITAMWLYLDTTMDNKITNFTDNGRVLRLTLSANNDQPGFYTCRAFEKDRFGNFITYGVSGKNNSKFLNLNTSTVLAIITTVSLVIFTLSWLIWEGYNDVCDGYGFFRDYQLLEDEKYEKEDNQSSENVMDLVKARRRRLSSQLRLNTEDDHSLLRIGYGSNKDVYSEPEQLPDLPEIKKSNIKPLNHTIFKCEPSVSSPHTSQISSTKTHLSTSFDTSPRHLCSYLLMTKQGIKTKENVLNSNILKIEAQSKIIPANQLFTNNPTVKKILEKFYNLKSTDDTKKS